MFRFENRAAFTFLYMLPVLAILIGFIWSRREKLLAKALNPRLKPYLTASLSKRKRIVKLILEALVVVLAVFALARPQFGESQQKVKSQGIELLVALDVSKSMLAEDIKPSRLEHAKNETGRLLQKLSGDKVGLIAFAGSAVVLSPLTPDHTAVRLFLDSAGPDSVTTGGTNFKAAIDTAVGAVKRGGLDTDDGVQVTKVLLIITDGESTTGDALEAARKASNSGVRIFALGIGTRAGAPIPERDEFGNLKGYKKDKSGQSVLSTAQEDALSELAQAGGGAYYHSDFSGQAIEAVKKDIDRMQKAEFESDFATNYDERFQPVLLLAIIFALIELFLGERRKQSKFWKGRFEITGWVVWLLAGALFSLVPSPSYATGLDVTLKNNKAVKAFKDEKRGEAYNILSDALVDHPKESALSYNLGHTFEVNEEKDKAFKAYSSAAKNTDVPELKFNSLFNAARIAADLKQKDAALSLYQQALEVNPDSQEVKTNIELLMKSGGGGGGGGQNQQKQQKQDKQDNKDQKQDQPDKGQDRKQQEDKKPQPKPFKSQDLSQQDVNKILDELRRQEEQVRAKFNEKYKKESPVDKDW